MSRVRRGQQRGFTLVETMMAASILAVTMVLVYGSFSETFHTKSTVEATIARYHTVRLAMERISREVSMAYVSQNEDTSQTERRTFFIAKRRGDVDELRFSMFGHQRLYADANESDTTQVLYYGLRDRDDNRVMNLVRRETRRLSNVRASDAPGDADILCDNVLRLQMDYWDARNKQWREEWNTTTADGQPDRLPKKVRITLTVRDERGKEVPFQTTVRLPIDEPLSLKPRDQR